MKRHRLSINTESTIVSSGDKIVRIAKTKNSSLKKVLVVTMISPIPKRIHGLVRRVSSITKSRTTQTEIILPP